MELTIKLPQLGLKIGVVGCHYGSLALKQRRRATGRLRAQCEDGRGVGGVERKDGKAMEAGLSKARTVKTAEGSERYKATGEGRSWERNGVNTTACWAEHEDDDVADVDVGRYFGDTSGTVCDDPARQVFPLYQRFLTRPIMDGRASTPKLGIPAAPLCSVSNIYRY